MVHSYFMSEMEKETNILWSTNSSDMNMEYFEPGHLVSIIITLDFKKKCDISLLYIIIVFIIYCLF